MSLTISQRLAIMSGIGLVAVLCVGAVGLVQMGRIKGELDDVQQRFIPALEASHRVSLRFSDVRRASVLFTNAPSDQIRAVGRKLLSDGINAERESFVALKKLAIGLDEEKQLIDQEERILTQYLDLTEKLAADVEKPGANRVELVEAALKNLSPISAGVIKALDQHARYYDNLMLEGVQRSTQRYSSALWVIILCTVIGLLILGVWTLSVYARVVRPLVSARDTVTRVERDKDFRIQTTAQGDDEVGQVLHAFNRLLKSMREAIGGMRDSADKLGSTAHGLQNSAQSLSGQVSTQSEAASTIASAMEEMTVSVSLVANQARDARQASDQAGAMAHDGAGVIAEAAREIDQIAQVVKLSSEQMNELETHSQRINSVVSVIRDVADQTNLLALNAAIEAARAGEQGRGFAVVADEVRKLAERTSVSTQEIAATVASIQTSATQVRASMQTAVESVERGVVRAQDASNAIGKVSDHAARATQMVTEISGAISEQSAALTEIAKQVEVIARMSEENDISARSAESNATALSRVAEQLQQTASIYQV